IKGEKPAEDFRGLSCLSSAACGATHSPGQTVFLVVAEIHLDLGQVDLALFFLGRAGVINLFPIPSPASAAPAGIAFHLPLAFDAGGAIRQRVQAGHRDLALAVLADAVNALLDP